MAAEFVSRVGANKDSSSVRERQAKMASQSVACGAPNSMPTEEDEGEDFFFFHFGTGLGRNKVRSPEQSRDQVCWIISFIFLSPMALSSPTFQNNRDTTSPGATTAVQTKIQQMVFSDRTVENV
jgi:hypothetical protein